MEPVQHIIIDHTLARTGDAQFSGYLCHAYCHEGHCTFDYNNLPFRFEAGDCLIIPSRGELLTDLVESSDFQVDVIYVTQEFIQIATPQSNYGTRGHLSLFENPIMRLTPVQQERCASNFAIIIQRLSQPQHHFYRDVLINAVQTMILDFFDFHAELYGMDKISSQNHQLMEQFIQVPFRGVKEGEWTACQLLDHTLYSPRNQPTTSRPLSHLHRHRRRIRLLFPLPLQPLRDQLSGSQTKRLSRVKLDFLHF